MEDLKNKKILITGGAGFLGSHVVEELIAQGATRENLTIPRSSEHDLREKEVCDKLAQGQDIIIHLAAKVGGIGFNQEKPGELTYDNLSMGVYMIDAAHRAGVEKILILGTVCAYPKFTPVPFIEEDLWNGYPEETNAPYGLAKKALLIQAQTYRKQYGTNAIFLLPVNLYGPRDSFDPKKSHVIPALIKKVADAKEKREPFVELWGTGRATREFLFVEDAARGIVAALKKYDGAEPVNLGSGMEISIKKLIETIAEIMGYQGELRWNISRPDGQPRRMLATKKAEELFGFRASTNFEEGLKKTIAWYLTERSEKRVE